LEITLSGMGGQPENDAHRFGEDIHAFVMATSKPEQNAGRAVVALAAYARVCGWSGSVEETARDLVTDLVHLAGLAAFDDGWIDQAVRQHGHEAREMKGKLNAH